MAGLTDGGPVPPGHLLPGDTLESDTEQTGQDHAPWPLWLQSTRLPDALLAEAYEATPPPHRACVKQCLALLHALWGEDCEEHTHSRSNKALGFAVTQRSCPAPWALFVVSAAYAAPTRLAAALLPALLARVPHVAVLCVGGIPSTATRVTLELAGIQDIFCPAGADTGMDVVRRCLYELCIPDANGLDARARGCVALLHHGELAPVAHCAGTLCLPLWEEAAAPRIVNATDSELVRFCHPDVTPATAPRSGPCDAAFGQPCGPAASTLTAPLLVGEGLEGFWLHTALTPGFFRRHSLHLTPYTGEDSWART